MPYFTSEGGSQPNETIFPTLIDIDIVIYSKQDVAM